LKIKSKGKDKFKKQEQVQGQLFSLYSKVSLLCRRFLLRQKDKNKNKNKNKDNFKLQLQTWN